MMLMAVVVRLGRKPRQRRQMSIPLLFLIQNLGGMDMNLRGGVPVVLLSVRAIIQMGR